MTVHITFNLVDPDLDSEELEAKTQNLLRQLREFDAVEQVDRVLDPPIHQQVTKRLAVFWRVC